MRHIDVTWIGIQTEFDKCLGWNKVLYAYYDSNGRLYYIGKADDQTLRQRLTDPDKASMVGILRRNGGQPGGIVYGLVNLGGSYSPASSVISNAEALLIREESPWGNVVKPRITEDIRLECTGSWQGRKTVYEYAVTLPAIAAAFAAAPLSLGPRQPTPPIKDPMSSFYTALMLAPGTPQNQSLGAMMRLLANVKKP